MKYQPVMWGMGGVIVGAVLMGAVMTGEAQAPRLSSTGRKPYTRLTTPRIKPIETKDFTPEQRAALTPGQNPNDNMRTALYEPEMGKQWWKWLTFVWDAEKRPGSALPFYDKELVILRTNFLCHDDWVWVRHVPIAKRNGRSDEDIARIPKGPDAKGWNENDAALLRAVDELHADSFISDDTWKKLAAKYNTKQMLDLIFTVGNYHTNAFFTNSVGMPMGEGFGRMPKAE